VFVFAGNKKFKAGIIYTQGYCFNTNAKITFELNAIVSIIINKLLNGNGIMEKGTLSCMQIGTLTRQNFHNKKKKTQTRDRTTAMKVNIAFR